MASCLLRKSVGFHFEVQGSTFSRLKAPDRCQLSASSSSNSFPPSHERNISTHDQTDDFKETADTAIPIGQSNDAHESKPTADIRARSGHKNQPKKEYNASHQLSALPEVLNDKPLTVKRATLHSRARLESFPTTSIPCPLIEYGIPSLIPTSRHHDVSLKKTDTAIVNSDDQVIDKAGQLHMRNGEVIAVTKPIRGRTGAIVTATAHTPCRGRKGDQEPELARLDLPVIQLCPEISKTEPPSLAGSTYLLMNKDKCANGCENPGNKPTFISRDDLDRESRRVVDLKNKEGSQDSTSKSFNDVHGGISTQSKRSQKGLIPTSTASTSLNESNPAAHEHQENPDPDVAVLKQSRLAVDMQVAKSDGLETTPEGEYFAESHSLSQCQSEEREYRTNSDLKRRRILCQEDRDIDSPCRYSNKDTAIEICSSVQAIQNPYSKSLNATKADEIRSKNSENNSHIKTPMLYSPLISNSPRFHHKGNFGQQADQSVDLKRKSSVLLNGEFHDVASSLKEAAHDLNLTSCLKISPGLSKSFSKVDVGFHHSNSSDRTPNRSRTKSDNFLDLTVSRDFRKHVSDESKNINSHDPNIFSRFQEYETQERKNGESTLDNAQLKNVVLDTTIVISSTSALKTVNSHANFEDRWSDTFDDGATPFKHHCSEKLEPAADGATPFSVKDLNLHAGPTGAVQQLCENKIRSSSGRKGGTEKAKDNGPPESMKMTHYLWLPFTNQLPEGSREGCSMAEAIKLPSPKSNDVKENINVKATLKRQRVNRFKVVTRLMKMPQRRSETMEENKTKVSVTSRIVKTNNRSRKLRRPGSFVFPYKVNAHKVTDLATHSVNRSDENSNQSELGAGNINSHYEKESAASKLILSERTVGNTFCNSCLEGDISENRNGMRQSTLALSDKSNRNPSCADATVFPKITPKMPLPVKGRSLQDVDFPTGIESQGTQSQGIPREGSPSVISTAAEDSNVFAIYESQSNAGLGKGVAQNENKSIGHRLTSFIRTLSPEKESEQHFASVEKSCSGSIVNSNKLFKNTNHPLKPLSSFECASSLRELDKRILSTKEQSDRLHSTQRIPLVATEEMSLLRSMSNTEHQTTRISIDDIMPSSIEAAPPSVKEQDKISIIDKRSTSVTDFEEEAQELNDCSNISLSSLSTCRSDIDTVFPRLVDWQKKQKHDVDQSSNVLLDAKNPLDKAASISKSSSLDSYSATTSRKSPDIVEDVDSFRPGSNTENAIATRSLCSLPRSSPRSNLSGTLKCDVQHVMDKVSTTMTDGQATSNHDIEEDRGQPWEAEEQSSCLHGISVNIKYRPSSRSESRNFDDRNHQTLKTPSSSDLTTKEDCESKQDMYTDELNATSLSPDHRDIDLKHKCHLTLGKFIQCSEALKSPPHGNAMGDPGLADPGGMYMLESLHRDDTRRIMQLMYGELAKSNNRRQVLVPTKTSPPLSSFDALVIGNSLCSDTSRMSMTDSLQASKHHFEQEWTIDFRKPAVRMVKGKEKFIPSGLISSTMARRKLYIKRNQPPFADGSTSEFCGDNFTVEGRGMSTAGVRRAGSLRLSSFIDQVKRNQMDDFDWSPSCSSCGEAYQFL